MSQKPSYLGLLNAIAVGEQRGYELLTGWAQATSDEDVRDVLTFVAAREREHAAAFAKRISELGYQVREREDNSFARRLEQATGEWSDRKKFKKLLGYGKKSSGDAFANFFGDPSIDPQTGALLGRFIAEERDSGRRLQSCFDALKAAKAPKRADQSSEIAARLDRLTETLNELKSMNHG